MKKYLAFLLCLCVVTGLSGCGDPSGKGQEKVDIADSVSLLNVVWASYSDEEKFPAVGGDMEREETTGTDGPGKFETTDASVWDYLLAVPETSVGKIDNAASLVHMMNANTFTCSAVHVKDGEDPEAVAKEIKENIGDRQWMCGQPDKMLIVSVGGYVVSAYGEETIMNTFKDKVLQAYPSADVLTEEAIVES